MCQRLLGGPRSSRPMMTLLEVTTQNSLPSVAKRTPADVGKLLATSIWHHIYSLNHILIFVASFTDLLSQRSQRGFVFQNPDEDRCHPDPDPLENILSFNLTHWTHSLFRCAGSDKDSTGGMDRLIPLIAKLQELLGVVGKLNLGQTVDLPQIVVVGSQRHRLALRALHSAPFAVWPVPRCPEPLQTRAQCFCNLR